MMDDFNLASFMSDLLRLFGWTPDELRLQFLANWARFEGANSQFNPLATTQPGGENPSNPNFNDVGVRNYASWQRGVQATHETMTNGYYPAILAGLDTATVTPGMTAQLRTWGTTGFAAWIDAGNDPFRQDSRGGGIAPPVPTPAPQPVTKATVAINRIEFRAKLESIGQTFTTLGTLFNELAALVPIPSGEEALAQP